MIIVLIIAQKDFFIRLSGHEVIKKNNATNTIALSSLIDYHSLSTTRSLGERLIGLKKS